LLGKKHKQSHNLAKIKKKTTTKKRGAPAPRFKGKAATKKRKIFLKEWLKNVRQGDPDERS